MQFVNSNVSNFARVTLLCALGSALISLSAPSKAASTTLSIDGRPTTTVTDESGYWFQPKVTDAKKSPFIKFDIYNKPAWASFDGTNGRLWGRAKGVGTYSNIIIRVTDWWGYTDTAPFSITVVKNPAAVPAASASTAPTNSGHASTPAINQPVINQPAINKPVINPTSAGTAALDWIPPTENTDGSVLTDLAGYNVHYGTSPDQLTQVARLANPGLASYVVDNLSPGKWYFAVSSYATNGAESSISGVVSTTIL
jgi:Putative Ig domain